MNLNYPILRPILTEKTMNGHVSSQYCFEVQRQARKAQIVQAIESIFKVNVISIRISRGKSIRLRTGRRRLPAVSPITKKAFVTLKSGQSISYEEKKA